MADASQRMSFVRDGYGGYDRKSTYEQEAALLSGRFGGGACTCDAQLVVHNDTLLDVLAGMEPAFKRARTSALASELGLGMDMQETYVNMHVPSQ